MNLKEKASTLVGNVRTYWKKPMKGRFMPFREIAAYSGGGIGAYMLVTLGTACLLSTSNTLFASTLGIDPTDMYIMYLISVIVNIPLTGIRANIIDNTRNKAGKYRPYIVTMGIPTAIICNIMVWFPYDKIKFFVGEGQIFGQEKDYVVKCALLLILSFLLNFFYYFFYDSYENLIHVLSPNTIERSDVVSVKSVVYSFAPTVVNLVTPMIASVVFDTNTTDIRVYRLTYPILAVLGILLCIVVYKYTEEKIVQAKSHVIQISFLDALREVAKNKYFWIISLAGWIGFLESAYGNILFWLYNYGGVCNGPVFGIIQTVYGNASLWGMLIAPFCIRRWGKKSVLVVTNLFNIVFILMMLPATAQINGATIWLVLGCLYLNGFMGSFAHILNPSIQADIRDYQQYRSGERIDGMFGAVGTIGTIISLATSSILPMIYEKGGITKANAMAVTSNPNILNRMLGEGKTVGQILAEQFAQGQDSYTNAYSALYDFDVLIPLLHVLIIVSAVGALMNVVPYFWYDFNERKQQSVYRVLKVRALFEDFNNGALTDAQHVEAVDLIRDARKMAVATPRVLDKNSYRSIKDKAAKKAAKKKYREDSEFNENIEISKFVCDELDKFSTELFINQVKAYEGVYASGYKALHNMKYEEIVAEYKAAKALPKNTDDEKKFRKFSIEVASKKKIAYRTIKRHFADASTFVKPDFAILDGYYDEETECDKLLKSLYEKKAALKKEGKKAEVKEVSAEITEIEAKRKKVRELIKSETKVHVNFHRAARPFLDAEKLINQKRNYSNFAEIEAGYDAAKVKVEAEEARKEAEFEKEELERKKEIEARKAQKEAKKNKKK